MTEAGKQRQKHLGRFLLAGSFVLTAPLTAAVAAAPPKQHPARPDIVLFIADDMSREDVGVYGSPDARTPNIDRLAREGLRFANAFAASPTCTPSRSSLFTGDYPIRNGAHANHSAIKDGIETLPSYLKKLGYRVVIAGKTDFGERANFPFEYFPASVIKPPRGEGVLASNIDLQAIDKLLATRDRKQPLALVVASFASHVPWPDNRGYDAARLSLSPYLLDTPETRQARTRYLTKVTQADSEMGAVRASIARHGTPENTVFLFTADQGAQLPFAKWNLYDAGIATPLLIAWPGRIPASKTTNAMVSLVDLLPTLEEAAGGEAPRGIDGKSFLPVLLGKQDAFHSAIYAAHSGDPGGGANSNVAPMRAIRTDRYKLIVNFRPDIRFVNAVSNNTDKRDNAYWLSWLARAKTDPRAKTLVNRFHHRPPVELYDIKADPYEQHNLADDPRQRETLRDLRARLDTWIVSQGEDPANVALPSEARKGNFGYAQ